MSTKSDTLSDRKSMQEWARHYGLVLDDSVKYSDPGYYDRVVDKEDFWNGLMGLTQYA